MFNYLITALCLQLINLPDSSKYYSSCVSSTTAASIQYSIKPVFDKTEERFNTEIKRQTGEAIWWVIGVGYAYQQKGVANVSFSARPIVDSVNISGNQGTGNLNLTWFF